MEYTPSKLKAVRDKVLRGNTASDADPGGKDEKSYTQEEAADLVRRVARQRENRLKGYLETMSGEEISLVAGSIASNRFRLSDRTNLYRTVASEGSEADWMRLLRDWENYYTDDETLEFLVNGAIGNPTFQSLLKNRYPLYERNPWLGRRNCIEYITSRCSDTDSEKGFRENLAKSGVISGTRFCSACLEEFYLICPARVYLAASDEYLAQVLLIYDEDRQVRFCCNLVSRLSLKELGSLSRLRYCVEQCEQQGHFGVKLNNALAEKKLLGKYQLWGSGAALTQAFGTDRERYDFWAGYIRAASGMHFIPGSETLLIEFGNIVVTELRGASNYPAYFYVEEFFRHKAKHELMFMTADQFWQYQSELVNPETSGRILRLYHDGSWKESYRKVLKGLGIFAEGEDTDAVQS